MSLGNPAIDQLKEKLYKIPSEMSKKSTKPQRFKVKHFLVLKIVFLGLLIVCLMLASFYN